MTKRILIAFVVIALCSAVIIAFLFQFSPKTQKQTMADAISYIQKSTEPDALLMLDVMYRRFGIEPFKDALSRYDRILASSPEDQKPHLRVFRRIADFNNPLQEEDMQIISADLDAFIVPALYCDKVNLPIGYSQTLKQAMSKGGLYLTHVLLACIWISENGCESQLPAGFQQDVYYATASLINFDSVVDEVELEAAAFLHLAGQGSLVKATFSERVIATQNDDGGWSRSGIASDASHWHSTTLGLLFLLHLEYPANIYSPMLATA